MAGIIPVLLEEHFSRLRQAPPARPPGTPWLSMFRADMLRLLLAELDLRLHGHLLDSHTASTLQPSSRAQLLRCVPGILVMLRQLPQLLFQLGFVLLLQGFPEEPGRIPLGRCAARHTELRRPRHAACPITTPSNV